MALAGSIRPEAPDDLTELSIGELMEIKVDTVYGASKYEQRLAEAPSSVSIVTAQQIRPACMMTDISLYARERLSSISFDGLMKTPFSGGINL